MKKLITLAVAALLMLTGCGGQQSKATDSSSASSSSSAISSSSSSSPVSNDEYFKGMGHGIKRYDKNINKTYLIQGIKIKISKVSLFDITKLDSDFEQELSEMGEQVGDKDTYIASIGYDVENPLNEAVSWSEGIKAAVLNTGEQINLTEHNLLSDYNPQDQTIQNHAVQKENALMFVVKPSTKSVRLIPDEFQTNDGSTVTGKSTVKEITVVLH